MKVRIEIQCENAAFGDTPEDAAAEVSRILYRLSSKLGRLEVQDRSRLLDSNGNTVGFLEVER